MPSRFLTTHQVAALLEVSASAVLRWVDQGLLAAFRTPGGHRRVRVSDLLAFLRRQDMPVPPSLEPEQLRLLVIDDEVHFLKPLKALLKRADARLEVDFAEGAIDGLLKVGLRRPDVVLIDAYMPGMDGVEVCRRLKAAPETAHVSVVAMSGRPSSEVEGALRKAGAAAFVPKPLTTAGIVQALTSLGLLAPERSITG